MQRSNKIELLKGRSDPELDAVAVVLVQASYQFPDLKIYNDALWNLIHTQILKYRKDHNKRGASNAGKVLVEKRRQHHYELIEAGKSFLKDHPNASISHISTHLIEKGKTHLKDRQVREVLGKGGVRRKKSGK